MSLIIFFFRSILLNREYFEMRVKFVLEDKLHFDSKNVLRTKKQTFREYEKRKDCVFLLECIGATFQEFEEVVGEQGGWAIYSNPLYGGNVEAWPAPFVGERNNIFLIMEPQDRDLLYDKDKYYCLFSTLVGKPLSFNDEELESIEHLRILTNQIFPPELASGKSLAPVLVETCTIFLRSDLSDAVAYVREVCVQLSSLNTYESLCKIMCETIVGNIISGKRDRKNDALTESGETIFDFPSLTPFENGTLSILFGMLRGVWDVSSAILVKKYGDEKTAVLSVGRSHGRMVKKLVDTMSN